MKSGISNPSPIDKLIAGFLYVTTRLTGIPLISEKFFSIDTKGVSLEEFLMRVNVWVSSKQPFC